MLATGLRVHTAQAILQDIIHSHLQAPYPLAHTPRFIDAPT